MQTKLAKRTGKIISAEFRLTKEEGKWKIYDVIIEGVSIVNNYRSQINSILVKSSYEKLVQKMKQKLSKKQ